MSSESQTISVVIPTYNRSAVLRRALASVRAQTHAPDEIIVVDDGSTDDTAAWLQNDCDDVRYLHIPQKGVSAARNHGVERAVGTWIAFLDSDDEWLPEKLEHQLAALSAHSEHVICHTDEIWIRNSRRVNPKRRHAKTGGSIFQNCLPLCVISPSSVLLRRSLLRSLGGFDETMPACEDYDLWLRVCSRYPVLFVDEKLVTKHGGHDDQLSRKYWGMDRFRIYALGKVLDAGGLSVADRRAALHTVIEKIDVFVDGARKRSRAADVEEYLCRREGFWKELASIRQQNDCS